ncbi:MAG: choice-of-anchor tandem repeat GloVer-containing protein [Candidatus Cybelea sp.]
MRISICFALAVGAGAAVLPDCSGSQAPMGAPGTMPQSATIVPAGKILDHVQTAASYKVLYNFGKPQHDAAIPTAGLIEVKGTLYGTTTRGGAYGGGTVFSVSTAGKEEVIYNFGGGSDGYDCMASLIDVEGTLYGTTAGGGKYGGGTVFSITTTGTKHILHNFGTAIGTDGSDPEASLIYVNGTLYGTTAAGGGPHGKLGGGTVFSISTTGTERVLYRFRGRFNGIIPMGGLIDVNNTLYGTTSLGGAYHQGTVFSVTMAGQEHLLYSFRGNTDGSDPEASLIDVNGVLYGTAVGGGKNYHGTVFSITTAGNLDVLHRFDGSPDGANPFASLIDVKGVLYGTTEQGGTYPYSYPHYGTVFSTSTTGRERVVHSFGSGSDGNYPAASLIDVRGTLYGTTENGGRYNAGTVFELRP